MVIGPRHHYAVGHGVAFVVGAAVAGLVDIGIFYIYYKSYSCYTNKKALVVLIWYLWWHL